MARLVSDAEPRHLARSHHLRGIRRRGREGYATRGEEGGRDTPHGTRGAKKKRRAKKGRCCCYFLNPSCLAQSQSRAWCCGYSRAWWPSHDRRFFVYFVSPLALAPNEGFHGLGLVPPSGTTRIFLVTVAHPAFSRCAVFESILGSYPPVGDVFEVWVFVGVF